MSTATSVYRYLDADGVLIYVGITNRGVQRQGEHNTHAKWWRFVTSQDVEHYDDRETALRRERYLTEKHQPPFNVVHNPDHQRRLAAYLKHADPELKRCSHCEGCQLDAAGKNDGDPYGCRWWWADEPDEEPDLCSVCGSKTCLYTIGHHDGGVEGWQAGFGKGEEYAAQQAHKTYTPAYRADYLLRAVIDGAWPGSGYWNMPDAETSLRDLEAAIAEHGVAALVAKAVEPPF